MAAATLFLPLRILVRRFHVHASFLVSSSSSPPLPSPSPCGPRASFRVLVWWFVMRTYHGVEMGFGDPRCERHPILPTKPSLPLPHTHSRSLSLPLPLPLTVGPSLSLSPTHTQSVPLSHAHTVGPSLSPCLSGSIDASFPLCRWVHGAVSHPRSKWDRSGASTLHGWMAWGWHWDGREEKGKGIHGHRGRGMDRNMARGKSEGRRENRERMQ